MEPARSVAIGGLGAIGLEVARALDRGIDGLRLDAVSARDRARASATLATFAQPPALVELDRLAEADIVVEALPAAAFEAIARPAVAAGRILVVCSVGALLRHLDLVDTARRTGARIIVASGALPGLDAVRAAAEGRVSSIGIETRKPPAGLAGAPYLIEHGIDVTLIAKPTLIFDGNAIEAAAGFPANANVAAALALAGIGPERTRVQIWADPTIIRNTHTVRVEADAARIAMTVEGVPSEINPRTGKLTPLSVLACLRGLGGPLKVGS